MAGEIQLNSITFATESGGAITVANVDSATNRQNLGLEIGVDVQAFDTDTTKNDVANTFTANQTISVTDNTNAALRVTQLGTGNAIVVEDSTNPDSSPFVVDSSGNVGIGTSSPSDILHVVTPTFGGVTIECTGATADPVLKLLGASGNDWRFQQDVSESDSLQFRYNNSTQVKIDSSGNVNIPGLSASSDVQTDASKNLITTSDARLKNDLGVITDSAINVVQQIIPKYFSWKNDESNSQQLGFFAQDLYPVLPEAAPRVLKYIEVGKDENDEPILEQVLDEEGNPDYEWGFTDRPIIAMCVKAIQEQQTIIESQQSQIDALTARIEALETA